MSKYLDAASKAYYEGNPIIDDSTFDAMAKELDYNRVGYRDGEQPHYSRLYSLDKVYSRNEIGFKEETIETPKLDGLALSLLYVAGELDIAITRGNGIVGKVVTNKVRFLVPEVIDFQGVLFVTGEVVAPKTIENARNYASGSINLKSIDEFRDRVKDLKFIAYDVMGFKCNEYDTGLMFLRAEGINTVLDSDWEEYPQDGRVIRVNDNRIYNEYGFTAKFPKGAIALKDRTEEEIKETVLLRVEWQLGGSKVTPVAHFEEIELGGAKVSKATLHNAGFVEDLDLNIGDILLVRRSGQIIPQVIGKVYD